MAISVQCMQCGTTVAAPDDAAGKKGRCAVCGEVMELPGTVALQPAAEPAIRLVEPDPDPVPVKAPPELNPAAPRMEALPSNAFRKGRNEAELLRQHHRSTESSGTRSRVILYCVSVLLIAAGAVFGVYFLPGILRKGREVAAEQALHQLENAEFAYFEKHGEFAQHLSGKNGLETLGTLPPELTAAEPKLDSAVPCNGYVYRILLKQGANAEGGEKNYLDSRQKLTTVFAILAYPADNDPAKTFLRGPDGAIYARRISGAESTGISEARAEDVQSGFDMDRSGRPACRSDPIRRNRRGMKNSFNTS